MMDGNSSTGSGTVMQRLLAEHYLNEVNSDSTQNKTEVSEQPRSSFNDKPISTPGLDISDEHFEARLHGFDVGQPLRSSDISNSRSETMPRSQQVFPLTPRLDASPAARLDALCRSTLEKSNNMTLNTDKSTCASASTSTPCQNAYDTFSLNVKPPQRSATREVLSRLTKELDLNSKGRREREACERRLPPPSYLEAQKEVEHSVIPENGLFIANTPTNSPRYAFPDKSEVTHKVGSRSFPSEEKNLRNINQSSMQLNGHPKSNSGGDEYLYTDQRKNLPRRGLRSKKNKNNIARSSSLHQHLESATRHNSLDSRGPRADLSASSPALAKKQLDTWSGDQSASKTTPHPKHVSSRSAPSQNSGKEHIKDQRRSSLYGALSNLQEAVTPLQESHPDKGLLSMGSYSQIGRSQENEQVQQQKAMQHTPSVTQAPFIRDSSNHFGQAPHGSFYPGMSNQILVGQNPAVSTAEGNSSPHAPLMTALRGNSPPRPPPPPYPSNYGNVEGSDVKDLSSWHPQRPNSLAIGNFHNMKNNNNSSLNSPALTSPTSSNCFVTPMRGTPFYSNNQDSPYSTQNQQMYGNSTATNSPHQRQTSNGSNSYLRRSGSGNNGRNSATASSSSSSTTTGASTPSYPETPSFSEVTVRSPMVTPYGVLPPNHTAPVYSLENYSAGSNSSGVSKSDSLNSTSSTTSSSGASRIASRRKRNSSSKSSYGNTSGSGSSVNSGSRPNSTADLTDRLEIENENLRNRLESARIKLRKFESIESELSKINQSHQALQQSANKREKLEKERLNQLTAKLQSVEKERDYFENQVTTLTEQLKAVSSTLSKEDTADLPQENSLLEIYQAKNRKLAEKERQLEEELEECRDRISEQNVDIQALTASLNKSQAAVAVLKENFLQSSNLDTFTEHISERMSSLEKIVNERVKIESTLRERMRCKLQAAATRPLKSTSSNDEGISEMDSSDPQSGTSSSIELLYSNPEDQVLGTKAEMLKWKQKCLEQDLVQDMQSLSGPQSREHRRLRKALSNHRHAMSDPGLDKISLRKNILPSLSGLALQGNPSLTDTVLVSQRDEGTQFSLGVDTELVHSDETVCSNTTPCCQDTSRLCTNSQADFACQTHDNNWCAIENLQNTEISEKSLKDSQAVSGNCPQQNSEGQSNQTGVGMVETDSPSEGYHSQQSSGSPTPNTERSTIHFPMTGDTSCHSRDIKIGAFRRNRSADVLTTLDV